MYEITRQKKIVVAILAFILSLMVGYAVFSESLNVKGTAKAEGDFALIFNSVNGIKESGSTGATADISPDKKTLTVTVPKLQYPTAYAEIDVTIKNIGSLNAYLKGIETIGLDTTDIKVTYSGINKNDLIGVSQEKKMKIKVTWDEASTATNVDAAFEIGLTFEQETSGKQTTTTTTNAADKTYQVGDRFCLGDECFYVIKDNGSTVTALSQYNINLNSDIQSKSAGTIAFSETRYWSNRGLSYPADVYDSNSLLYNHVENYENYLKTILGKTSTNARLITYNELVELGCRSSTIGTCESAPSWVYDTTYWSATAYSDGSVWFVGVDGSFSAYVSALSTSAGIRPVITISKTDIASGIPGYNEYDYFIIEDNGDGVTLLGLSELGEIYYKSNPNAVIEIPLDVEKIASGAFVYPYNYSDKIDFGLLEKIYEKILAGDSNITEEEQEEANKLSDLIEYNKTNARLKGHELVIPSTVRKIGSYAFFGLKLNGKLLIPNSVTEVGPFAFAQTGFSGVSISNNLKRIEAGTFYEVKTNTIEIPSSVTYIGMLSFSTMGLSGDLTIPDTVKEIEGGAFSGNNLSTVYLSSGTSYVSTGLLLSFDSKTRVVVR